MSKQSAPLKYTPEELWIVFQRWLPIQVIQQLVNDYLSWSRPKRGFYQRLFPPWVSLWGFVFQRLNPDHSCDAFVSYLNTQAAAGQPTSHSTRSESTAAYCKARQRLPVCVASKALRRSAEALQAEWGEAGRWHGFRVNLFDGSTLRLSASQPLSEHYGVASNQYGPSHWPILRLVAGFDLFCGAVWQVVEGPYRWGEHRLACLLIRSLGAGFLHIGDRGFGVYHLLQVIQASQSQALLRLKKTQARRLGAGSLHSGCDLDRVWSPSRYDDCEPDLPSPAIAGRLIYLRLTKNGFRPIDLYLFTTLTDREAYPAAELVALYGQRWQAELNLRHVKTTLEMESLAGKSVDIVRKDLVLGLLAYNLIRGLIGLAAQQAQRLPLELSLARCWRRIVDSCYRLGVHPSAGERQMALETLLERLGRCRLPKRKHERFEPRAVWGKPRVYPTIKGSREQARQAWFEMMAKC